MTHRFVLTAFLLLVFIGCGGEIDALPADERSDRPQPVHVDSTFPIEEEIRRFREGLETVETLAGGAPSVESLVQRFVDAVERADTAALAPLVLSRAEFAYLYYPHTRFARKPYALSPALLWFQIQNRSSRGVTRLLRRYAGNPVGYRGHQCNRAAEPLGEGSVRSGCVLHLEREGAAPAEFRLFGPIVEHAGRFKFLSYANEL